MIDFEGLRAAILEPFDLPVRSLHGPAHWGRVEAIGVAIAGETGADLDVVRLFALFHDARRMAEADDPGHGLRGAELARAWRGSRYELGDEAFARLFDACAGHTDGTTSADPTIGACWDADRLDLPRVGIRPRPEFLSTEAALAPALFDWATGLWRRRPEELGRA